MFTHYWQRTSRKSRNTIFNLSCLYLLGLLLSGDNTQAQGIQHELSAGFQFMQHEYTQDHYVVNAEALPSVTGQFEGEFWWETTVYTFFLKPLDSSQTNSIALQHFYSHPTTLRVSFAIQPETETTYTFENSDQAYQAQTLTDDRARKAGVELEYYFRENTGLLLLLNSLKNEEATHFSNTLNLRGRGEQNEIRRYYGLGVSQYWRKNWKFSVLYTAFDAELAAVENAWTTENPLLSTEAGRESNTEGNTLQFSGEYIWRKRLGIQGFYRYTNSDSHSTLLSSFYENFPGMNSYYDEETTAHTAGLLVSAYINDRTTFRIGGSLGTQTFDQTYETDQVVAYDWDVLTFKTSLEYFLNQHVSLQLGYEFSTREAAVAIGHPQSERTTATTSQIVSETHTAIVSILARF